jgi:hypothetical protein
MIRDPSDGTVKEIGPEANKINAVGLKQATKEIGPDTGLRQPTRTDAQLRLEESRKWLKNYQEKQNARGAAQQTAGDGLRVRGEGLEQQGDRSEARDQPADGRGSSGRYLRENERAQRSGIGPKNAGS